MSVLENVVCHTGKDALEIFFHSIFFIMVSLSLLRVQWKRSKEKKNTQVELSETESYCQLDTVPQ
jgi:hypothetical protein